MAEAFVGLVSYFDERHVTLTLHLDCPPLRTVDIGRANTFRPFEITKARLGHMGVAAAGSKGQLMERNY